MKYTLSHGYHSKHHRLETVMFILVLVGIISLMMWTYEVSRKPINWGEQMCALTQDTGKCQ